jgi:hypothetical protein
MIAFGPDGFLYMSVGDGGGADDPLNSGQNLNTLLAKILRLDVSGPGGYAIPADNPFAGGGGRPEIWATGVRNPWRFSFDRQTGDLYEGDVGQGSYEEVNRQAAGAAGGANYGWPTFEGYLPHKISITFPPPALSPFTFPILTYGHGSGDCSITGGYVYRGPAGPAMVGGYLYGDFCTGKLWFARPIAGTPAWSSSVVIDTPHNISSFGEDEAGNVYLVAYGGSVFKIVSN